jgi:hypothetical protein
MDLIRVSVIDHKQQRYPTVGDWFIRGKNRIVVFVSKMTNPDYIFLVAMHEIYEGYLCLRRGISEKDVTRFDVEFEAHRTNGHCEEPGDDPRAPYFREHQAATAIEKMMAKELGVDWEEYDKTVATL